ncbi:MAG TPA: hypothetical protein EYH54_00450, partial [Nautiliaceae bacterium]|nr:hypothetical protein [Nautiliaceae bacterium]
KSYEIIDFKKKKLKGLLLSLFFLPLAFLFAIFYNKGTLGSFFGSLFVGFVLAFTPYFLSIIKLNTIISKIEEEYLLFLRDLYSNSSSGLSLNQAISILANKDYSYLTPYIKKLNVWISWAVPFPRAFNRFTELLNQSDFIRKANNIILESYKIGGDILNILKTLSEDLYLIRKLEDEKRSALMGQAFTMGFIFFILVVVLMILKGVLIPILAQIKMAGAIKVSGEITQASFFKSLFASIIYVQAIIVGLMIGIILNGTFKSGMKYALVFFIIGFLTNMFFISTSSVKLDLLTYSQFANPGDPVGFSLSVYVDGKPYSGSANLIIEDENKNVIKKDKYIVQNGIIDSSIKLPENVRGSYVILYAMILYEGKEYKSNKITISTVR